MSIGEIEANVISGEKAGSGPGGGKSIGTSLIISLHSAVVPESEISSMVKSAQVKLLSIGEVNRFGSVKTESSSLLIVEFIHDGISVTSSESLSCCDSGEGHSFLGQSWSSSSSIIWHTVPSSRKSMNVSGSTFSNGMNFSSCSVRALFDLKHIYYYCYSFYKLDGPG